MPTYSERPVQQATILRSGGAVTFESLRNATTGNYIFTGKATRALAGVGTAVLENTFSVLQRGIYTFDTSSIPADATITSGILIITPTSVEKTLAGGKVGITGCSPTDPRSLAKSDYSKFSDTLLSDSLIADPTGGNLTFELNAAGLSNIVPGSDTTFMLRVHWDINGVFNGTWGSGVQHTVKGTVLDPSTPDALLVVEYAVESGTINELEGASTGIANSSGVLSKHTSLSGSVSDTTSLSGVLSKNTPLSGSVVAATFFSGVLSKHTSLSGSVSATTSLSGGATVVLPIVAVIEPVSTASGTVLKDIRISGIVASVVNITSQIGAILPIGCTLSSVSTITGDVVVKSGEDLSNWPNTLKVAVTDPPLVDNFALRVVVEHQTGMRSDFADLRFSLAGAIVPHVIWSYTASTEAEVWVKVPANTTSFTLHYGKSDATDASAPDAVFILCDRFDGNVSDKWTVVRRGEPDSTVSIVDGVLAIGQPSNRTPSSMAGIISKTAFDKGIIVEYRDAISNGYYAMLSVGENYVQDAQGTQTNWHYGFLAPAYAIGCNNLTVEGQTYPCRINKETNWSGYAAIGPFYTELYEYEERGFSWSSDDRIRTFLNGSVQSENIDDTHASMTGVHLMLNQGWFGGVGGNRYIDWVRIRPYQVTEPTTSISYAAPVELTGAVVGLAGTAGALTRQRTVAGVAGGSSVVSGILPVEWNLSSGIAASSTCSGDVSSGYAADLAGTVSAVTICSGTAIRDLSLTCTVSARAVQVSGSLARAIPVSGNISAASNFYAVLDQHSSFYGLVTTNSTIAGRLAVRSVRTAEACARPVAAALIRQVKGGREIEARVGRLSGTTQVARAQVLAATGYLQKITGIAKVSIKLEYKRFLVIEIDLDFVTMELDLDHSVMELDLDFKVVELRS